MNLSTVARKLCAQGISERRVQKLCEENRIPGIAKFSRMWLIPKDAEKPMDKRKKRKGGADNEK